MQFFKDQLNILSLFLKYPEEGLQNRMQAVTNFPFHAVSGLKRRFFVYYLEILSESRLKANPSLKPYDFKRHIMKSVSVNYDLIEFSDDLYYIKRVSVATKVSEDLRLLSNGSIWQLFGCHESPSSIPAIIPTTTTTTSDPVHPGDKTKTLGPLQVDLPYQPNKSRNLPVPHHLCQPLSTYALVEGGVPKARLTQTFNYWTKRNLKGPKPYPFAGTNLYTFIKCMPLVELDWYKKTFNKSEPVLKVAKPELIKTILVKDFHLFSDRVYRPAPHEVLDKNLIHSRGEDWKRLRSIMSPTFTSGKM
ncbi:unnamed protein product, partial [Oppiella nova]